MITMKQRVPWHLWPIGGLALVFNALAAVDMGFSLSQPETYNRICGMTAQQIAYFDSFPMWVTVAWIASVAGGLLGAIALLMRSAMAGWILGAACAATAAYTVYGYFLSDGIAAMGAIWFMPAVVTVLTGLAAIYALRITRA